MAIQALRDPALLRQACLIGGNWQAAASGRSLDVIDPATQEAIGYPLGSLRAAGIDVQLGSDAPVSPLDPWHAIAAAVHRTGDDRAPWHPEERLDIETALRASAHRGTAGNGGVRLGGAADLVLVEIDPARATRDELRTMPVRTTLLAGRITHHSARTYGG